MVKISTTDIVRIMRRFMPAEDCTQSDISRVVISNPSTTNTLAIFRYKKSAEYGILFDDTAEDDLEYLASQVARYGSPSEGTFIPSPETPLENYAISFEAKDVYLYRYESIEKRLDIYLASLRPEYSRSTWQKYIKAGYVSVNGIVQKSTKYAVAPQDMVDVAVPALSLHTETSLPIVYQDEHVMVIDKPAGILTHSKGALNDEFTVASFFARFGTYKIETNRPGIVHRLDRDTSGILIGALDDEAGNQLGRQFSERKAKKVYYAVVKGHPRQPEAVIDLPIGRNPSAPSTFRVDASGKYAETYYKVEASNGTYSLLRLEPKTGRTHQLRVHMAYIGCPILGDKVYGGAKADRLYLHAHSLEITIPGSMRKTFTSPVPQEFLEKVNE